MGKRAGLLIGDDVGGRVGKRVGPGVGGGVGNLIRLPLPFDLLLPFFPTFPV